MTTSKELFIVMDSGDGVFGRHTQQQAMDALCELGVRPSAYCSDIVLRCNKDLQDRLKDMTIERDYWKLKAESK